MNNFGKLDSIIIYTKEGRKLAENQAQLVATGISGDKHCDIGDTAISILSRETVEKYLQKPYNPGDFGENLLVSGIDLSGAKVGDDIVIEDSILKITKIGISHDTCENADIKKHFIFAKVKYAGIITIDMQVRLE